MALATWQPGQPAASCQVLCLVCSNICPGFLGSRRSCFLPVRRHACCLALSVKGGKHAEARLISAIADNTKYTDISCGPFEKRTLKIGLAMLRGLARSAKCLSCTSKYPPLNRMMQGDLGRGSIIICSKYKMSAVCVIAGQENLASLPTYPEM